MKKIITLILVITLTILMVPYCRHEVYAYDNNEKALQAYKELLTDQTKAGSYFDGYVAREEFALLDLNQDGISEMVLTADSGYHTSLLAFVDGKVKVIGGSFAAGDGEGYYPNKKMFFTTTLHTDECYCMYYKFNGRELVEVAEKYGNLSHNARTGEPKPLEQCGIYTPYKYTVKGKVVTAKTYRAYVKRLKKGAIKEDLKYIENTESNRNKYL